MSATTETARTLAQEVYALGYIAAKKSTPKNLKLVIQIY